MRAQVVATSQYIADQAALLVTATYANEGTPILSIPDAIAANSFFPTTISPLSQGNVNNVSGVSSIATLVKRRAFLLQAFPTCDHVVEGSTTIGSQVRPVRPWPECCDHCRLVVCC